MFLILCTEIFGISDHDLMFSKEAVKDHGSDDIEESEEYIQQRVGVAYYLFLVWIQHTEKIVQRLLLYMGGIMLFTS